MCTPRNHGMGSPLCDSITTLRYTTYFACVYLYIHPPATQILLFAAMFPERVTLIHVAWVAFGREGMEAAVLAEVFVTHGYLGVELRGSRSYEL